MNSYPTGCPRYIRMSVVQRRKIVCQAHLCIKCHDPDYIHQTNDPSHKCPITTQKKSKFTCSVGSCLVHMWICVWHREKNLKLLAEFKEAILNKYKLDFGYIVAYPLISSASFDPKTSKTYKRKESASTDKLNSIKNSALESQSCKQK